MSESEAAEGLFEDLNDRQRAFCFEYLKHSCNGAKAAIAAGYAKAGAAVEAHRLLRNANIRSAINGLLELKGYTPEFCINKLGAYATADIADFEPWLTGLATFEHLARSGVDISVVKSASITEGKYGESRKLVMHDALKAVETLAKLHGLFSDKGDVQGDSLPILEVTKRIVIDEYMERRDEPIDLGIPGLEPLRRIYNPADNGRDGDDSGDGSDE